MRQYDINLRGYWRVVKKRKLTVLLTTIVLGVLSTLFCVLRVSTPLYSSTCSIRFEKEIAAEDSNEKTIGLAQKMDIEAVISLLKSYPVIKEAAERLGKITEGATAEGLSSASNVEEVIADLQSKVEISRGKFTDIIEIKVTDNSPVLARDFANSIALTYKDLHVEDQYKRSTKALRYIAEQLKETRQKLEKSEDEFNMFVLENQLGSIYLQSEKQLSKSKGIRDEIRQLEEGRTELNELVVKLRRFIENPSGSNNDFHSAYADKQYQGSNYSLVELLLKRDSLLEDLIPKHPEVVEVQRKIVEVARKMSMVAQSQTDNMDKRRKDLEKELAKVEKRTTQLIEKNLEYDRLKRRVDSYTEMITLLERKSQEVSIRSVEKPKEVTIIKPALLPTKSINRPSKLAIEAMGVIIGLILGILIAFIMETLDPSLGAIEDVEKIPGAQVLGVVPHRGLKGIEEVLKDKNAKQASASNFERKLQLVSHFAPNTFIGEAFRSLRTNILFADQEKKIKTLAVTSASPQEGKTIVAANLAITIAQAGMKTLLVECDLRKPLLADVLGIENIPGITDVLLGNYLVSDVVRTITDIMIGRMSVEDVIKSPGLENLDIITSGTIPPNPGELIDSKRLADFIEEAKKDYDLVIFDTSPILSTADPMILGTKVDTVLVVYRLGGITRRLLKRSMVQLSQVKCHVAGVVLNDMKADVSPDFQDFKYHKYYSDGGEKKSEEQEGGDRNSQLYNDAAMLISQIPSEMGEYDRAYHKKGEGLAEKGFSALRLGLLLIGLGVVISGLLWQNGMLPIDVYLFENKPALTRAENALPEKKAVEQIKMSSLAPVAFEPKLSAPQEISSTSSITPSPAHASYPYSLRAGSFRTLEKVQKAVDLLKKKGLDPYWCEVDLGEKGKWFRVFVGYFKDPKDANEFKERHALKKSLIRKTAYAVQIGGYLSDKKLDPQVRNLKKTDLSAYFIEEPAKGSQLLIGAFVSHEAAEGLAQRVRETGTDCKVVLR